MKHQTVIHLQSLSIICISVDGKAVVMGAWNVGEPSTCVELAWKASVPSGTSSELRKKPNVILCWFGRNSKILNVCSEVPRV